MLCSAQFVEIVQIFMVTKGRKLAVLWINILPGSEKFWWYWKQNNFRSRTKTWEFACTVQWTLGRLHNSQFVNNLFTFISSCMLSAQIFQKKWVKVWNLLASMSLQANSVIPWALKKSFFINLKSKYIWSKDYI